MESTIEAIGGDFTKEREAAGLPPWRALHFPANYEMETEMIRTGWIVSGIAVLGLAGTALLVKQGARWEAERLREDFERDSRLRIAAVKVEIDSNRLELAAFRSFFNASREVTRAEFRTFATRALGEHADIRAFEWIPRVPASRRKEFERRARAEGFSGFQFWERNAEGGLVAAGERREYFPVFFVEPLAGNESALGYDLGSDEERQRVIREARRSGRLSATSPVRLVQQKAETEEGAFLTFVPIKKKGKLEGFVLGVYLVRELVQEALRYMEPAGIDFSVYDATIRGEEALMYRHVSRAREPGALGRADSPLVYSERFPVGGRVWRIDCTPTPKFLARHKGRTPGIFLVSGLLFTFLLSYLAFLLARRGESLALEVKSRTEQLRLSEERWAFALDGSRDGVWDWNAVTNKVYFSKRWKEMLGYDENDVGDDLSDWETRVHPEDKERVFGDLTPHMEGRTAFYENEHRMLCKDGSYKWVLDRGKVIARDAEGKPLRAVGTHTDISERKKLEEQRRELIRLMTHDLKAPLAATVAAIHLVLDSEESKIEKTEREALKASTHGIDEMIDLIEGILDPDKLESGGAGMLIQPLAVEAIAGILIESLEPLAAQEGVHLRMDSSLLGEKASGDARHFRRILINLISNSLKFSKRGGTVRVVLRCDDKRVQVSVVDQGCGIPKEFRDKVFTPYAQARETDKTEKGGTGLGLAGAKEMAEAMGGALSFVSEPDVQTTFTLTLDRA
jgi:PAS domain S-box-containing protein